MQRIFVECSYTCLAGGRGGIRRVARNLANLGPSISGQSLQVAPLVWGGIGFFTPSQQLSERPHPAYRLLYGLANRMRWLLDRFPADAPDTRRVESTMPGVRADGWLARFKQGVQQFRESGELLYLLYGLFSSTPGLTSANRVNFRPGDIVVLVDSTWNSTRMLSALMAARSRHGIRVGAMIHDLFPLTIPHMCHASTARSYCRWFDAIAPTTDFFITNSEATRNALEKYLRAHPEKRSHPILSSSFPLGASLETAAQRHEETPLGTQIRSIPGYVLLAVGTIEPRKNYSAILDAFDMLTADHEVSLIIVGREGWSSDELMQRLAAHPLRGTRLVHLDNATDADLAQAFEHADCLICASWDEGFGLPVVEGLMHGLPVLASDISVFREVGGQACNYFNPGDPASLRDLIVATIARKKTPKPDADDAATTWISWEESARRFRDRVAELASNQADNRQTPASGMESDSCEN